MRKQLVALIAMTTLTCFAAHAQVTLTNVRSAKLRYVTGETATFTATVKNAAAQPWTGRAVGVVESGLAQVTPVFDQPLQLAAGAEQPLQGTLKIALPDFGHTFHVSLLGADGKPVAEGRDVFCVGPWYYNMGRCTTIFELRRYKSPEQVEAELIPKWRTWGITTVEHFSGMPGIWGGLVPTTEEWYAGQGGYAESMTGEKSLIEACHRNGMAVTVYDIFGTYATPGEEYSRAHPEMITYNDRGRPEGWFNMADMDLWRHMNETNHQYGCPGALTPNVSDPKVQDFGIDEIIRCARLFKYDGIRWDGHTFGASYNIAGKKLQGDLDELNARWTKKMRAGLLKALPGFTVNYNYYPQSTDEGPKWPKTYDEMGPNAYVLWESMRGRFKDANDPLNNWEAFIEGVRKEVNGYARPHGNFQHLGWYASDSKIHQNHTQAIYYALGAHWDTFGLPLRYDQFSIRYGAVLWDTKLVNSADPSSFVQVADPNGRLWWKQFVQERSSENGRLLITHVINKPMGARQDPFDKATPPVQQNVTVTVTLKPGEKLAHAYMLNPDADPAGWCTEAQVTRDGDRATVTLPSVEFWSFVVWEVQK